MRRYRFAASLGTAIVLSCGYFGAAQAETTLSFLHKWPEPENMAYFREAVEAFEAQNPDIKVDMEAVADEPYKDKIRVLMGSGQVPDVFFSWSGEFGKKFSRAGRSLDITDELRGTDWEGNFSQASLGPFEFEGRQYGVPINIDAKFMLFNEAIFAEHGLSKPATYEDFLALNATLKDAGVTPIAFGNQYPWAASHYLGDLIAKLVPDDIRLGDYNLERPADELYTHPGYIRALNEYKKLNDEGYFNRGSNALTHSIARGSFLAGRTAMMFMELVEFVEVTDDTPLGQAGWSFFAMPGFTDGEGRNDLLTGAPDGFMISADTKHKDEAIRFLKFLTSPEQARRYVELTGMTSAVNGAVDSSNSLPQVVDGLQAIHDAGGLALWLDTDMDARSTEVLLAGSQALLNNTATPEEIMTGVQQTAKEVQAERNK